MRVPPCLFTPRLRLRPRTKADVDANVAMDLDPEVYPYSEVHFHVRKKPPDPIKLRESIRSEIAARPPQPIWVIEWNNRPGFLGLVGLLPCAQPKSIAISFRLVRSEWGKGIATEAARSALEHGFRVMKLQEIVALVHPENHRSRHVVEKAGLRCDGLVLVAQRSILSAPPRPPDNVLGNLLALNSSSYSNKYICYRLSRTELG
jgi:RimJ/RimL family protein N-acetyltransferase